MPFRKRKRGASKDTNRSLIDPVWDRQIKRIPPNMYNRSRQSEPESREPTSLIEPYCHGEVEEVIPSQVAANGQSDRVTTDFASNSPSTSADLGNTKVFQPDDAIFNQGFYRFSGQADTQLTAALSLEAIFNRNPIPLCQRPYGAPIFMHVLHGDISGV